MLRFSVECCKWKFSEAGRVYKSRIRTSTKCFYGKDEEKHTTYTCILATRFAMLSEVSPRTLDDTIDTQTMSGSWNCPRSDILTQGGDTHTGEQFWETSKTELRTTT